MRLTVLAFSLFAAVSLPACTPAESQPMALSAIPDSPILKWDVAGVSLGMAYADATAILSKAGYSFEKSYTDKEGFGAEGWVASDEKSGVLLYREGDVVWKVNYKSRMTETDPSVLIDAVEEKYGTGGKRYKEFAKVFVDYGDLKVPGPNLMAEASPHGLSVALTDKSIRKAAATPGKTAGTVAGKPLGF